MYRGYVIAVLCFVALCRINVASSRSTTNIDGDESSTKGNKTEEKREPLSADYVWIEFPLRINDSSNNLLSIAESPQGEYDIESPFVVKDPVKNVVYTIFPKGWEDVTACELACREGGLLADYCQEFEENKKQCPKQSRVCVLEQEKSDETLEKCTRNSDCSAAGHRCCFDRCANATICKPEKRAREETNSSVTQEKPETSNSTFNPNDVKFHLSEPITAEVENGKKYVIFPKNWNDTEQCRKRCPGNNGTLECCQDESDKPKLCPRPRRVCVNNSGRDDADVDSCLNDENCSEGQKCCYDRCLDDTICKKVRRKKDY